MKSHDRKFLQAGLFFLLSYVRYYLSVPAILLNGFGIMVLMVFLLSAFATHGPGDLLLKWLASILDFLNLEHIEYRGSAAPIILRTFAILALILQILSYLRIHIPTKKITPFIVAIACLGYLSLLAFPFLSQNPQGLGIALAASATLTTLTLASTVLTLALNRWFNKLMGGW